MNPRLWRLLGNPFKKLGNGLGAVDSNRILAFLVTLAVSPCVPRVEPPLNRVRVLSMKLALGQINPTVGDLAANVDPMIDFCRRASPEADVVLFPELSVSGYPPRDLVDLAGYAPRNKEQLERLARATADLGVDVFCGHLGRSPEGRPTNSAAYLAAGEVRFEQQKTLLPTYDVFDEWRHFAPAGAQRVFEVRGHKIGLTICEGVWNDKQFWKRPLYGRCRRRLPSAYAP